MAQVNREGLIIGIVVVKDNLVAVGIVTYQSVAKTSVSVDCGLGGVAALGVRYALQIVDLQGLPGLVVNVSYAGLLSIIMVGNGNFNVLIAKFNSAACYIILIRRVTADSRCCHIIELLRFSRCPSDFTSYQILNAIFTKVFSLDNSWLSGLAIFKLVINS